MPLALKSIHRYLQRIKANGQEQFTQCLKLVNPPSERGLISHEKDAVTALSNSANKKANPVMKERFASTNPNDGGRVLHKGMHLFAGNRRGRAGMKDFCRIHTIEQRARHRIENLCDAGFCEL